MFQQGKSLFVAIELSNKKWKLCHVAIKVSVQRALNFPRFPDGICNTWLIMGPSHEAERHLVTAFSEKQTKLSLAGLRSACLGRYT